MTLKIGDFGLSKSLFELNCLSNIKSIDSEIENKKKINSIKKRQFSDFKLIKKHNNRRSLNLKEGIPHDISSIIGTPLYQSPEVKRGELASMKCDIFAVGCIYFELLASFSTVHEKFDRFKDLIEKGDFGETFCLEFPEETALMRLLLVKDPNNRPSIQQIQQLKEYRDLERLFKIKY